MAGAAFNGRHSSAPAMNKPKWRSPPTRFEYRVGCAAASTSFAGNRAHTVQPGSVWGEAECVAVGDRTHVLLLPEVAQGALGRQLQCAPIHADGSGPVARI